MLSLPVTVMPFNLTNALMLVVVTFIIGYVWLVNGFFWNKFF